MGVSPCRRARRTFPPLAAPSRARGAGSSRRRISDSRLTRSGDGRLPRPLGSSTPWRRNHARSFAACLHVALGDCSPRGSGADARALATLRPGRGAGRGVSYAMSRFDTRGHCGDPGPPAAWGAPGRRPTSSDRKGCAVDRQAESGRLRASSGRGARLPDETAPFAARALAP